MSSDSSAKLWNKMAERYAKQPIKDEASYQFKIKKAQEYLQPDMDVLEFGCGTGTTALIHAPKVNHITGLDIADKMTDIASRKADEQNIDNAAFHASSFEEFTAPEASFDAIMAYNILHLLGDEQAAISKVHRLLKPGGLFISSTPCLGVGFSVWKLLIPVLQLIGKAPLVQYLSVEGLLQTIHDSGFTIDYQWQQPAKIGVLFTIARKQSVGSR